MIDLGKYASTVLSSYAVSLLLLAAIVGLTLRRNAAVRDRLAKMEAQARD